MYKEIKTKIQKNEDTISYSEEEVVEFISKMLLKKSQDYKDLDIEELRKNWKKAFANGLTILGMIHGAHFMNDMPEPKSERQKSPTYQRIMQERSQQKPSSLSDEEQIKQAREQAMAEGKAIIDKYDQQGQNIDNFLDTISMNESSGGIDTDHEQMKHGIHAGDSAIGKYGLMPNTIKEMAVRMGSDHPMAQYAKMDSKSISESIKKNPDHEQQIAKFMANHLHDRFGGDESKMAYAWNQGHNLTDKHFSTSHKNYLNHDYVQKYQKHKSQSEKPPQKTQVQDNSVASIE